MTMNERVKNAEMELKRVKALAKVHEMITSQFNSEFCQIKCDEDSGEYICDENGNFIYEEKPNEALNNWYYDYDLDYALLCKSVFKEVLSKIENMK